MMTRAHYYLLVLRTGRWLRAKYHRKCLHCEVIIQPNDLYLGTGVRDPNGRSAYSGFGMCRRCSEEPIPATSLPDLDPTGATEYGKEQLKQLKLLVVPVKS